MVEIAPQFEFSTPPRTFHSTPITGKMRLDLRSILRYIDNETDTMFEFIAQLLRRIFCKALYNQCMSCFSESELKIKRSKCTLGTSMKYISLFDKREI